MLIDTDVLALARRSERHDAQKPRNMRSRLTPTDTVIGQDRVEYADSDLAS
jgi:hypothetical protein